MARAGNFLSFLTLIRCVLHIVRTVRHGHHHVTPLMDKEGKNYYKKWCFSH